MAALVPLLGHVVVASSCAASAQCVSSPRHYHEDAAALPWASLLLTAAAVASPLLYVFSDDQVTPGAADAFPRAREPASHLSRVLVSGFLADLDAALARLLLVADRCERSRGAAAVAAGPARGRGCRDGDQRVRDGRPRPARRRQHLGSLESNPISKSPELESIPPFVPIIVIHFMPQPLHSMVTK